MKSIFTLAILAASLTACGTTYTAPDPRIAQCAAQGKILKRDNSGITRCNVDFDASEQFSSTYFQSKAVAHNRAAN